MDRKKILLVVGALLFAALMAFGVNIALRGATAPQVQAAVAPKIEGPMVMVATRPLAVGTIVTPEMVRFQPWPSELMESAYFVKDQTDVNALVGSVVRNALTAGEPVTQGSLVKPGERGFLAAALGPGMRAVTIKVDIDTGVAGFIFPGDRVDLVMSSELDAENGGDKRKFVASETFIRNIRVLATDQRTDSKNEEGKDEVKTFTTVTLEATPVIAEKIAVAERIGRLSLSLRSLADTQAELERAIATGEIKMPKNADAKVERDLIDQLAQRPIDKGATATTGGQVSRYQRTVLPTPRPAETVNAPAAAQIVQAARAAGGSGVAVHRGETVRVIRGDQVTETPVGGN